MLSAFFIFKKKTHLIAGLIDCFLGCYFQTSTAFMCITPVYPLEKYSLFYKSTFFLVSTGGENGNQIEKCVMVSTEIPSDKEVNNCYLYHSTAQVHQSWTTDTNTWSIPMPHHLHFSVH